MCGERGVERKGVGVVEIAESRHFDGATVNAIKL
jgi:hypothetical protein